MNQGHMVLGVVGSCRCYRFLCYCYGSARVLHEAFLVFLPLCSSEAMLQGYKMRFKFSVVQVYNFKGLLGIRRMDRVPNGRKRVGWSDEGVVEKIDESSPTVRPY